ncbi:unnamed protein product, partial [Symbiodinium sp. CCMP2456]
KACTQLSDFRFDRDVSCHCCAIGHVNPVTGKAMICDHETIRECLRIWFGSTAEFEQVIRDRVAPTFQRSFWKHPLPYKWILGATVPTLWISVCNAMQAAHDGSDFLALQIFCNLSFWLAGFPVLLHIELKLAHLMRQQRRQLHCDVLVNLALALAGSFLFALYLVAEAVWMIILQDTWLGSACSAATWVVLAAFVWHT